MKYTLRSGVIQGNLSGQASVHMRSSHKMHLQPHLWRMYCLTQILHHRKQFQSSVSQTGKGYDRDACH